MPRHLHGNALRDAGADKIADSSSTEVMQDAARASGFGAGRPKGDPEALDWLPRPMKDARTDNLEPPLQILSDRSLVIKQFAGSSLATSLD